CLHSETLGDDQWRGLPRPSLRSASASKSTGTCRPNSDPGPFASVLNGSTHRPRARLGGGRGLSSMELSLPDLPFGMRRRCARARPRTQASLAVSADGENWLLINASPDLPQQVRQSKVLHPRSATRGSPIKAVVLTGAEIDQVAGLLSLREREPFMVCATPVTLAALAENAMFGVLAPDVVKRTAIIPGVPLTLPGEVQAQVFMVPGKLPLYLEGENPEIASETAANVGVEISAHNARMVYIPGAAAVTAAMTQRIKGADVVFFDGTLF